MMSDQGLSPTIRFRGDELFNGSNAPHLRVRDFWAWAASNLVDNVTRGLLAEYIVATALGVADGVRSAWDPYDLKSPSGLRVEVKSWAYVQAWTQTKPSRIAFAIGPKKGWDGASGKFGTAREWQSDVFVFCLLKHQDRTTLNPLNFDQWEFYVVPTSMLNEKCPNAKTVSLSRVHSLGIQAVSFGNLRATVENVSSVM